MFNIGLFLQSGVKLSEGFGSSYKMAEHRAAANALLSMFLVRNDRSSSSSSASTPATAVGLPSSIHANWPLRNGKLAAIASEAFEPKTAVLPEALAESGRR